MKYAPIITPSNFSKMLDAWMNYRKEVHLEGDILLKLVAEGVPLKSALDQIAESRPERDENRTIWNEIWLKK